MTRHGQILRLKPNKLAEYKEYHANTWPEILDAIRKYNIRNYSIYYKDGYLFAYFEYLGNDLKVDMSNMIADNPKIQQWQNIMMSMQEPLETRTEGEWWAEMEEVFHTD